MILQILRVNRFAFANSLRASARANRRFLATESNPKSLQGRPFLLNESQARISFNSWYKRFVPDSSRTSPSITAIRPVLVPFYGFYVDGGRKRIAVYGGYEYTDQQVEALKVSPSEWTKFDPNLLNIEGLQLDTWSITASQAATKASLEYPHYFQGPTPYHTQALLPGYLFEFTRRGQTFKVLVGADTGKASGLRHFSFLTGLREFLTFGLSGNSQTKIFLLLLLPRLVPPLGLGLLIWSVFRAFVSPLLSLGAEKLMSRIPISYRGGFAGERVEKVLADQWGHFDPKDAVNSSTFDEHERRTFQEWLRNLEESFRQAQQQQEQEFYSRNSQYYQQQQEFYRRYQQQQQQQYQQRSTRAGQQQQQQQYQYQRTQQQQESPPQRQDLYRVLGVNRNATSEELRQAFRKKLLLYHPDQYQGKDPEYAKMKTQEIVEAYRTLSNASKRSEYDRSSRR